MNGPEGARTAVADHLGGLLPAELADLEARLALPAGSLPAPAAILMPRDPGRLLRLSIDQFPAIVVNVLDTARLARFEVADDGARRYEVRYRFRVFTFARHQDADTATTLRDRYTLAVREVLLRRPTLALVEGVIDETTWRESLSETSPADQTTSIAAAFAEFEATILEDLSPRSPAAAPDPVAGWTGEVDLVDLPPSPIYAPAGDLIPVITVVVDRPQP